MTSPKKTWTLFAIMDGDLFVSASDTGHWWTAAPELARLWSAQYQAENWLTTHPLFRTGKVATVTFEA